MKPARFLRDERSEFTAARLWYVVRSPDAARAFTAAVERTVGQIRELRRISVPSFPYSVIYLATPDEVVILAVAHARRRPGYWRKRVQTATRRRRRR